LFLPFELPLVLPLEVPVELLPDVPVEPLLEAPVELLLDVPVELLPEVPVELPLEVPLVLAFWRIEATCWPRVCCVWVVELPVLVVPLELVAVGVVVPDPPVIETVWDCVPAVVPPVVVVVGVGVGVGETLLLAATRPVPEVFPEFAVAGAVCEAEMTVE
jgi:hypothetical protein